MDLHEIIHRTYMNNCLFPDMLKYSDYGAVLKRKLKQIHKIRESVRGAKEDQIDKIQPNHIKQINDDNIEEYIWYNQQLSNKPLNNYYKHHYNGVDQIYSNSVDYDISTLIIMDSLSLIKNNTIEFRLYIHKIYKYFFINTKDVERITLSVNGHCIYSIKPTMIQYMQKLLNMTTELHINENTILTELPINILNEGIYKLMYTGFVIELQYKNNELCQKHKDNKLYTYGFDIEPYIFHVKFFRRFLLELCNLNMYDNKLCDNTNGINIYTDFAYYFIIKTSTKHEGEFYLNLNNNIYCPLIKHSQQKCTKNNTTYVQIVSLTDNLSEDSLKEYGINFKKFEEIQLYSTIPINILETYSVNINIFCTNGGMGALVWY
jgi:hypothetical protein